MYGRCGSAEEARKIFDRIPVKNVVCWNVMIAAYAQNGHFSEALELYYDMNLKPDRVTFLNVLHACTLESGRLIHQDVVSAGLERDKFVGNALVNMFGKCGSLSDAKRVFDRIAFRDVISWNALMSVYIQQGRRKEAFELFKRMGRRSVVSWTCMIMGMVEHGYGGRALDLYREMVVEGVRPDAVALVCALDACTSVENLAEGRKIHRLVEGTTMVTDVFVATAVVNMYGKCGKFAEAEAVFQGMKTTTVATWNSLIGAYAQHGHATDALKLYERMELSGTRPDGVTLLCALFACSHLGLLDRAREFYSGMVEDYQVEAVPAHFGCLVDLFCRAGWIDEAEELIASMPVRPHISAWTALLNACKAHNDMERGAWAACKAHELDSRRSSPFVVLSGFC
ncbi:hypothetical protein SELMODRAFT_119022 [Selaginella moellendorffii]|uniref:Pentacotripeptide-repeat region of PRORP domain-containing protein n=1 Tax=Selaginella moellendorffii TaxID=88036 RepID=D8SJZ5_SELML|nr:hypothetical protein SELMODRAFT_119022 [Selaginella moellendorffii]